MASLTDLATIANDFAFQSRCMQAASIAAINVMAEGAVSNHTQRASYAQTILNGTASQLSIARSILTNSTIASGASVSTLPDHAIADSDIQFAMNSNFNALAGVSS